MILYGTYSFGNKKLPYQGICDLAAYDEGPPIPNYPLCFQSPGSNAQSLEGGGFSARPAPCEHPRGQRERLQCERRGARRGVEPLAVAAGTGHRALGGAWAKCVAGQGLFFSGWLSYLYVQMIVSSWVPNIVLTCCGTADGCSSWISVVISAFRGLHPSSLV